jgi:hypothetical protein
VSESDMIAAGTVAVVLVVPAEDLVVQEGQ